MASYDSNAFRHDLERGQKLLDQEAETYNKRNSYQPLYPEEAGLIASVGSILACNLGSMWKYLEPDSDFEQPSCSDTLNLAVRTDQSKAYTYVP